MSDSFKIPFLFFFIIILQNRPSMGEKEEGRNLKRETNNAEDGCEFLISQRKILPENIHQRSICSSWCHIFSCLPVRQIKLLLGNFFPRRQVNRTRGSTSPSRPGEFETSPSKTLHVSLSLFEVTNGMHL